MFQFIGGGLALAPQITKISVFALSQLKQLAWAIGLQSVSYIAVDKVTDYVIGDETDGYAETALDVLLSFYLARKGGGLVKNLDLKNLSKISAAKKRDFLASMGSVPWVDPRNLARNGGKILRTSQAEVNWLWSEAQKVAVLVGRRSGRVYGHLTNSGVSVALPDKVKLSLGAAGTYAAGAGGMWALDKITAVGLDVAAEQILDLNHEYLELDPRDVTRGGPGGDEETNKISFIRDPDIWLGAFGNDNTPGDILVDRAIAWFLGKTDQRAMTVIDDAGFSMEVIDNDAENESTATFDRLDDEEKQVIASSTGEPTLDKIIVKTRYMRGDLDGTKEVSIYGSYGRTDVADAANYQRNTMGELVPALDNGSSEIPDSGEELL